MVTKYTVLIIDKVANFLYFFGFSDTHSAKKLTLETKNKNEKIKWDKEKKEKKEENDTYVMTICILHM